MTTAGTDAPDRSPSEVAAWLLRVVWLLAPLAIGPVLGAALDVRSDGVQAVGSVAAWSAWVVVLVALLVPRATSLTVVRVGVPGSVAASAWAAASEGGDGDVASAVVAVLVASVATAVAFSPAVGDLFVNGSAYGAERRFALRCPPTLAALAAITWVAVAAGAVTGPLLLGARQWVAGVVATAVGVLVVVAGARSLHGLARRWLVFVPSGVVVHDPLARPESVMAPRPLIVGLEPAREGVDGVDLTVGAPGLVLELVTSEPIPVTVRRPGGELVTEETTRVLFTPTLASGVLAEAAARRVPVSSEATGR